MSDVTRILNAMEAGDPQAASQLLPLVYEELRKLAASRMAAETPGHTLNATALVHEAYLRLVPGPPAKASPGPLASPGAMASPGRKSGEPHFDSRGHFFAAAAQAMRRILVENARRKRGPKQGGAWKRLDADLNAISLPQPSVDLLALDEALAKLAQEAPQRAELVQLRYFGGMTMPEAARVLGISLATAERYWTYARTWLYAELGESAGPDNQKM
jgi:RNA polymerase sigma factor (sigma-70 family)